MSEILFNCHCLGDFMTEPRNNPAKDYAKAVEELAFLQAKTTKLGAVQEKNLIELPKLIQELEPYKDQIAISPTAVKRLDRMRRNYLYGIKDNLENKQLKKGIICEQDSIMLVNDVLQKSYMKNKIRKTNEFLTGEADIVAGKGSDMVVVPDVKTSWDSQTFGNTVNLKKGYYWQVGVGYIWLWEAQKGQVIHCLVNTPTELILADLKNELYRKLPEGMSIEEYCFDEDYKNHQEVLKLRTQYFRNHVYSDYGWSTSIGGEPIYHGEKFWDFLVAENRLDESFIFKPIPKHERVKIFEFKRNNEDIAFAKVKLQMARDYLNKSLEPKDKVEIIQLDKNLCET